MRRAAGIIAIASLALPLAAVDATSAQGAAATPTCKVASGKATFTPALPKIGSISKVKATINATGTEKTCTGGGVTSATVKSAIKFKTPGNCQTLAQGGSGAITGNLTLTWNNKKTSTIAATLKQVSGKPTQATINGPITTGLFKGKKASQTINFTISAAGGDCVHGDLHYVTFKQQKPLVIK